MFEGDTRNNQDIVNYIYEQFVVKDTPLCHADGVCCYAPQTEDQIGCFVGCLLPLEVAKKADKLLTIGNTGIAGLRAEGIYSEYFDEDQRSFLVSLQNVHDSSRWAEYPAESIQEILSYLCNAYDLEYPS